MTDYRTFVAVEHVGPKDIVVTSKPYPIHHATVKLRGGVWEIRYPSTGRRETAYEADRDRALVRAAETVSKAAGAAMGRFTGPQRYAMGQQQCPYQLGSTVCRSPAEPGTVWCHWHPRGKVTAFGKEEG
jgi:hypothetical protein